MIVVAEVSVTLFVISQYIVEMELSTQTGMGYHQAFVIVNMATLVLIVLKVILSLLSPIFIPFQ